MGAIRMKQETCIPKTSFSGGFIHYVVDYISDRRGIPRKIWLTCQVEGFLILKFYPSINLKNIANYMCVLRLTVTMPTFAVYSRVFSSFQFLLYCPVYVDGNLSYIVTYCKRAYLHVNLWFFNNWWTRYYLERIHRPLFLIRWYVLSKQKL